MGIIEETNEIHEDPIIQPIIENDDKHEEAIPTEGLHKLMDYELDDRPYHEDEMNREQEIYQKMPENVQNMLIDEQEHDIKAN